MSTHNPKLADGDYEHLFEDPSAGEYASLFNSPVVTDTPLSLPPLKPNQAAEETHKRHREDGSNEGSNKRAEILQQRRQTVLQLYQKHSEASVTTQRLLTRLGDVYKYKVLPLERKYQMHSFGCLPTDAEITDAELQAKPMVLLIGPYSTGKSTFICHLLGGEFPGVHIGPEPTTDRFMAIVHGNGEGVSYNDEGGEQEGSEEPEASTHQSNKPKLSGKIVKGNTMTVTPELPFSSLSRFGSAFLNHFNGSVCSTPLLKCITLIDTPGVLSGEKQRLNRSYDFAAVTKWFADRSDLILLLFDAHKLDVSDEFKQVVETIRPHNDDKIRCVLNKADSVTREQFVRVYGSLMWSMGKLFDSPEVVRVYTGSYWDEPLEYDDFEAMFESDEWLLIDELVNLPSVSAERKVNAMVKRIRLVKVLMCTLSYLREQMPTFGRAQARRSLLDNLDKVFETVIKRYNLSAGDMPPVYQFRLALQDVADFRDLPALDKTALETLDQVLLEEIPSIVKHTSSSRTGKDSSKRGHRTSRRSVATADRVAPNEGTPGEEEEGDEGGTTTENRSNTFVARTVILLALGISAALIMNLIVIPMFKEQRLPLLGNPVVHDLFDTLSSAQKEQDEL